MGADGWTRWITTVPLFRDLTEEELKRLLSAGRVREYAPGQRIIEEGQPSRELFILLSGKVSVEVGGVPLAEIRSVSPVGEMGVVDGEVRSADVVAMESLKVLAIKKEDFDRIIWEDKALGIKVHRNLVIVLSRRIREMDDTVRKSTETIVEWEELRSLLV